MEKYNPYKKNDLSLSVNNHSRYYRPEVFTNSIGGYEPYRKSQNRKESVPVYAPKVFSKKVHYIAYRDTGSLTGEKSPFFLSINSKEVKKPDTFKIKIRTFLKKLKRYFKAKFTFFTFSKNKR